MANDIQSFSMVWLDIPLTIIYEPDWLGLCAHLQFRAKERLPISDTGYKSIYLSSEAIEKAGGVKAFAIGLLDEAAQTPHWQRHAAARKQLSLF